MNTLEQDTQTTVATLPFFPGFYESMLSGAIDNWEEREADYMVEKQCSQEYHPETYQPEHLRLTAREFGDLLYKFADYRHAYLKIAQWWVKAFDYWFHQEVGTPEGSFIWESMQSPREYNFTTDRVFATIPMSVVQSLFDKSAANDHESLSKVIKASFTSYDGFMSFYSNDIEDWLEKPLAEWDYNEVGTLVGAVALIEEPDIDRIRWALYEGVFSGNNEEGEALNIDWVKFEAAVEKIRESKASQHITI